MFQIKMKSQDGMVYEIIADELNKDQVLEFRQAVKKPIPITACKMPCEFEVETLEGTMKGNKGDWLMCGITGEYYPCAANIFEMSYDLID